MYFTISNQAVQVRHLVQSVGLQYYSLYMYVY